MSTSAIYSSAAKTAQAYYNSEDADAFYSAVWGGEDIHIGLYKTPDEDIATASRRTVETMAARLTNLNTHSRVLDLGAGFGGAARFLAGRYGCPVVALNVSEVENDRNRSLNRAQGLDHLIDVVDSSFEDIPYEAASFDIVWSQDAMLHSGNRNRVVEEVARVLKPDGEFIFTDPMQTNDCSEDVLEPILQRIHLQTLGSPRFYRQLTKRVGLEEIGFIDLTDHLILHYSRVLRETENREDRLTRDISPDYLEHMKKGLRHWIDGGRQGHLCWGIFHFRKRR